MVNFYREEIDLAKLRHIKVILKTGNGCVKRSADIIKESAVTREKHEYYYVKPIVVRSTKYPSFFTKFKIQNGRWIHFIYFGQWMNTFALDQNKRTAMVSLHDMFHWKCRKFTWMEDTDEYGVLKIVVSIFKVSLVLLGVKRVILATFYFMNDY